MSRLLLGSASLAALLSAFLATAVQAQPPVPMGAGHSVPIPSSSWSGPPTADPITGAPHANRVLPIQQPYGGIRQAHSRPVQWTHPTHAHPITHSQIDNNLDNNGIGEEGDEWNGTAAPVAGEMGIATMGYPQLNAPLYPTPRPNIPRQVGGTVIVNQALAPHEMLYPHSYRAVYPPYYHRVRSFWIWTPFGMRSLETWTLQGTEVRVKYRSHYNPLSGFMPPVIR